VGMIVDYIRVKERVTGVVWAPEAKENYHFGNKLKLQIAIISSHRRFKGTDTPPGDSGTRFIYVTISLADAWMKKVKKVRV
jgi:hypothetical protein